MIIPCFNIEFTDKYTPFINGGSSPIYRRSDTGEENTIENFPTGAIWRAHWYENYPDSCGLDKKSYIVKTPGGHWAIDGRASNCGLPNDMLHKCWCRHGEVPNFTVDKNGVTCNAGSGSIAIGNYHGFLRDGKLVDA